MGQSGTVRPWLRANAAYAIVAAVGAVALVWLKAWPVYVNDYGTEAATAVRALVHGHLVLFLQLRPAYGGAFELRAPFILAGSLFDSRTLPLYRAGAVPCLLAGAVLAIWNVDALRRRGGSTIACLLVIGVCAVNPMTYRALLSGHPEEVLAAVLCVAAVLLAMRGRAVAAGVLLGIAIADKDWSVLALGPVLLGLPAGRLRACIAAAVTAALLIAPQFAVLSGNVAARAQALAVTDAGDLMHPWNVWWLTGSPIPLRPQAVGHVIAGGRLAQPWLHGIPHPLIVWLMFPLTWLAVRRRCAAGDALALLALLMLIRCVLDPWDVAYYSLPFLLALCSWEVRVGSIAPVRSVVASLCAWLIFVELPWHLSQDNQSIAFTSLALLGIALLAHTIYWGNGRSGPRPAIALRGAVAAPIIDP